MTSAHPSETWLTVNYDASSRRLRHPGCLAVGRESVRTTLAGMVNLTRIYTRTGDAGSTRLGDMSETSKTDLRLAAYADVDEANAQIGVALAQGGLADGRRRRC